MVSTFYVEITKPAEEFNLQACIEALNNIDKEAKKREIEYRENIIEAGHQVPDTPIEEIVERDMSIRFYPIQCMKAYQFLHELDRGIYSSTINHLYRVNRDIFNKAINDGYKPNEWCVYGALNNEPLDEIRRLIQLYKIDVNVIARHICKYDRFKISPEKIERRINILEIVLEENNFIWYHKDDNPFTASIISGDVIMSQMLLNHFGIDDLRVNVNNLINLALLNNSIHSPIINWIKNNFDVDFISNNIITMLKFRKHNILSSDHNTITESYIIHTEEHFNELINIFDKLDINIFEELISTKFEKNENKYQLRLFNKIYNKINVDEIDDKIMRTIICCNSNYNHRNELKTFIIRFIVEKGFYDELKKEYEKNYSYDRNFKEFGEYLIEDIPIIMISSKNIYKFMRKSYNKLLIKKLK